VKTILIAGVAAAVAYWILTLALNLLNRASDLAVAAGYLILVGLTAGIAELVRRWIRQRTRR